MPPPIGHPPSRPGAQPPSAAAKTAGVFAMSEVYFGIALALIAAELKQANAHGAQGFPSAIATQSRSFAHDWS